MALIPTIYRAILGEPGTGEVGVFLVPEVKAGGLGG